MSRRRGHVDEDGDWTAPRSREVRPITAGSLPCGGCGHALAAHPGREACIECDCVWFEGAPLQQPTITARATRRRAADPPQALPAVIGDGRADRHSVPADSHTWGERVKVSKPTGKRCEVCQAPIRSNEVMVPIGGWGRDTVWAHKVCR